MVPRRLAHQRPGPSLPAAVLHRDGIAVHGYGSVPAYPASHGCARVSLPAMDMIWRERLMPSGATVLVT